MTAPIQTSIVRKEDSMEIEEFNQQVRRICTDKAIRSLVTSLRQDRRQEGIAASDKKWFSQPLIHLLTFMEEEGSLFDTSPKSLTVSDVLALIVGMGETLSIRDAIICAIVNKLTPYEVVMLGCEPFQEKSAELVCLSLDPAFNNPYVPRRRKQTMRMYTLMKQWPDALPDSYTVYRSVLFSALAYIAWWMGEPELSLEYSYRSLEIDPDCNLASIMNHAVSWGAMPAWWRKERERKKGEKKETSRRKI